MVVGSSVLVGQMQGVGESALQLRQAAAAAAASADWEQAVQHLSHFRTSREVLGPFTKASCVCAAGSAGGDAGIWWQQAVASIRSHILEPCVMRIHLDTHCLCGFPAAVVYMQAQHEQRVSHLTRRAEAAEAKLESLTAQLAAAELAVANASSAANNAASSASSEVAAAKADAEAVRGELAAAKRDAEAEKNK